ncbi:MAG: formate dehydrogenase subunit gamma [Dokdonella sp.]|uniref:formate dehydrogenase subunit gamma n=1 Tax=Dokdonella sp. TaxID=2291710 RepID=UPI003F7F7AB8
MNAQRPPLIVRYRAPTRINHWLVAISFVLLALSGLALFHPALFWLSGLFGGGTWTRILHPFIGVFMAIAFAVLAATVGRANRLERRDGQWLRGWRDVVANREENLPEVGRYNAGQKLLFFLIVLCLVTLLLSGIVIWRAYFSLLFPIGLVRLAAVAHAVAATVLICAIVVHVYAAIWVKGSVRAMTRGTVSPGWAWKHHHAWFRDVLRGWGRE